MPAPSVLVATIRAGMRPHSTAELRAFLPVRAAGLGLTPRALGAIVRDVTGQPCPGAVTRRAHLLVILVRLETLAAVRLG